MIVADMFGDRYYKVEALLAIMILCILPRIFMGPTNPLLPATGKARIVRQIDW